MTKFSENTIAKAKDSIDFFPDTKTMEDAFRSLEELANITLSDFSSSFNTVFINDVNRLTETYNEPFHSDNEEAKERFNIYEPFLAKLYRIVIGQPVHKTLRDYYKELIDFYSATTNSGIQTIMATDPVQGHVSSAFPFNLNTNARRYINCNEKNHAYFYQYIIAYQFRNNEVHQSQEDIKDGIKCVFFCMLQTSLKYAAKIHNYYIDTNFADAHKKYISEKLESIPEKDSHEKYTKLKWKNKNGEVLKLKEGTCRLLGEPGDGKTTQMQEMYIHTLTSQKGKTQNIQFPVWKKAIEYNDTDIQGSIIKILNCTKEEYQTLYKANRLCFYFDGINEITNNEEAKTALAFYIDKTINETSNPVVITDRTENPRYMVQKPCFMLDEISDNEIELLIEKYAKKEEQEQLKAFFSGKNKWLDNIRLTPIRLIHLFQLITSGPIPENEYDFSCKYLEYIIKREKSEKKDTRINVLLSLLTRMPGEKGYFKRIEIENKWAETNRMSIAEAQSYITLALELGILEHTDKANTYKYADENYEIALEEIDIL